MTPDAVRGLRPSDDLCQLDLTFARGQRGRSELVTRRVSYPWSLTQPFYDGNDGLAYVIPQSASGGLYARERVRQRLRVGAGAGVLLRTQGATLVHRSADTAADSRWEIAVEEGARAELLSDLIVLGPGAALRQAMDVTLSPTGRLVLIDGWTWLEERGVAAFASMRNELRIGRADGTLLACERIAVTPDALAAQQAVGGGPMRAFATAIVAGPFDEPAAGDLVTALSTAVDTVPECWTGVGLLPGNCGVVLKAVCGNSGRFSDWSRAVWCAAREFDGLAAPADSRRGV